MQTDLTEQQARQVLMDSTARLEQLERPEPTDLMERLAQRGQRVLLVQQVHQALTVLTARLVPPGRLEQLAQLALMDSTD